MQVFNTFKQSLNVSILFALTFQKCDGIQIQPCLKSFEAATTLEYLSCLREPSAIAHIVQCLAHAMLVNLDGKR